MYFYVVCHVIFVVIFSCFIFHIENYPDKALLSCTYRYWTWHRLSVRLSFSLSLSSLSFWLSNVFKTMDAARYKHQRLHFKSPVRINKYKIYIFTFTFFCTKQSARQSFGSQLSKIIRRKYLSARCLSNCYSNNQGKPIHAFTKSLEHALNQSSVTIQ